MIKNEMTFPLAVDTSIVKATGDVCYTATDAQLEAYAIGFIPWSMIESSMIYRSAHKGTLMGKDDQNQNNYFGYVITQNFQSAKGAAFCYSYTSNAMQDSVNVYLDENDQFVNCPWGTTTTTGLIHSYDVDTIVNDAPGIIEETTGIYAKFKMFVLYIPDGADPSEGIWSSPNGENGWSTLLIDKTSSIDTLTLNFSVTSGTDGSYMPNPVTFTLLDLIGSKNGVMIKENGTTTYAGVTYHIYVHCAIIEAYLQEASAMNLKNGIVQLNGIRYSGLGSGATPYYSSVATGSIIQDVFTCGNVSTIDLPLPSSSGYYIKTSAENYEYIRSGSNLNNLLSGGFTETDLKIMRSVARPIYKISNDFYVAEFNDDFTITGNLIPYAQARTWQKFINPDTNEFDYKEIPDPSPSDEDWSGDRILPPVISGIGDLNGFITMYALTPTQIAALGSYLWAKFTDMTFWESISIVLDNTASIDPSNILNYVVSIRAYPFDLSDISGTTTEFPLVYFGRGLVGVPVDNVLTGTVKVIHKCVDTFPGGDLDVPANYDDFRDMEPCAKILLHVPFCGSCEINPSQVVGKHLFLRYTIDFATGGMMAICFTSDSAGVMAYPVAELHGHIGASVQLTASNEMDALQSIAGIGTGVIGLMTGNQAAMLSGVIGAASSLSSNRAAPHSTGRASGFSAYFQPRTPYIEIIYDQYYKPSDYAHTHGNACQIVDKIGNLHGYTVCKNVDTTGLTCEMDERISIKRILESGFFVD